MAAGWGYKRNLPMKREVEQSDRASAAGAAIAARAGDGDGDPHDAPKAGEQGEDQVEDAGGIAG